MAAWSVTQTRGDIHDGRAAHGIWPRASAAARYSGGNGSIRHRHRRDRRWLGAGRGNGGNGGAVRRSTPARSHRRPVAAPVASWPRASAAGVGWSNASVRFNFGRSRSAPVASAWAAPRQRDRHHHLGDIEPTNRKPHGIVTEQSAASDGTFEPVHPTWQREPSRSPPTAASAPARRTRYRRPKPQDGG